MAIPPLAGFSVAVTADRRSEEQVALLARRGADVVVGASVRTLPLVDDEPLSTAIESVIARPPAFTVLLTGIGVRGLLAAADGMGRDAELVASLCDTSIIARGPKAAGAAATAGLDVEWITPGERSIEIFDRLADDARRGARIAIQRDGQSRPLLADALAALGADAVDIPVYRWELPDDVRPARRVIDAVVAREVDAVTFTSSPAVQHLVSIAADAGLGDDLLDALAGDVVAACVGPVCAETAASVGIGAAIVPKRARLGAMVQTLAAHFAGRGRAITACGREVTLQGRAVFVDGALAALGARERSVLDALAAANGAVVGKQRLLHAVWGEGFDDDHAVEVAVARLRRGLGVAGDAIETVARRGYRLAG
ncbi:MAG: uroporphyrinogen-III synthase [Actinomycetota bacterium]|nr:uroporphyrinogen-III synthase [Actinomycetota bacterium]